ncbi:MAG: HIPA PROTEIN [uncultured Sulfurovum sp.]|uniref:HIPA PROTEIN n=1 Tax=uncultured Sulfurovum sp. TaxID=269237 RepID=A0A6S6UAE1_9BACT|nr:MAG: HIPA PROTEIN [uncultured Sulfurovum sp.]
MNSLQVFLNHREKLNVGRLLYKDRKIFFEYESEFLKSSLEISPYKLPLKEGLFECEDMTFEGLWGVFNDSLPDGWGRLLFERHLRKLGINAQSISPLERLSYVGRFGMGALSYEPEEEIKSTALDKIVLDDLATHSQAILKGSSEELLDELLRLGGSSAGARPKALIQINESSNEIIHGTQILAEGFTHWMVKFASSSDGKEVGAVEYAYSLMAKDAKLDMPKTTLLQDKKGSYFACERFDRVGDERIHMHTVAGLIHSDFRYPSLDYDDLLTLCLHLTKSVVEQKKVFRLACFNLFAHNRDDHSKNFSFLMNEQGEWSFSPVYDITFSSGPGGEHSTMYLGEGKNPTITHLLKLAEKHQIKEGTKIVKEVQETINKWSKFAKVAGVSRNTELSIGKIFKRLM